MIAKCINALTLWLKFISKCLCICVDHTARIWHAASGVCLLQYVGHTGSVNSIRFHPNSEVVLTSSGSQQAHLWKAHVSSHHSDVGVSTQLVCVTDQGQG